MGQYHLTVNLDKKQYLRPHRLGDGLKLLEQAGASGGVSDALLLLLAVSNGRGGGDVTDDNYSSPEIVGSWGGDRIAVIGDYAEAKDLMPEHHADLIYEQIGLGEAMGKGEDADPEYIADAEKRWYEVPEDDKSVSRAEQYNMSWREMVEQAKSWRDISDDIKPVLEKHLGFRYFGDGWQTRVEVCYEHPDKAKGHWDHADTDSPFIVNRPPKMSESEVDLYLRLGVPVEVLGVDAAFAKVRNGGWSKR